MIGSAVLMILEIRGRFIVPTLLDYPCSCGWPRCIQYDSAYGAGQVSFDHPRVRTNFILIRDKVKGPLPGDGQDIRQLVHFLGLWRFGTKNRYTQVQIPK